MLLIPGHDLRTNYYRRKNVDDRLLGLGDDGITCMPVTPDLRRIAARWALAISLTNISFKTPDTPCRGI